MKKLPKEKRNHLMLVMLVTGMVLIGLYFGLIKTLEDHLGNVAKRRDNARRKLEQVKQAITNANLLETQVVQASERLATLERDMASGDLYSWAINTIRQFKLPYKVEIPQFSQIDGPKDTTVMPGFPYKQATLTIGGTARFHDFGTFLADFENRFPYIRVENLSLEPAPSMAQNEGEKLQFRMDVVALVKPGAS